MLRRTFCEITSIAVVGTFVPFMSCSGPEASLVRKLNLPTTMATINESSTIIEVGNAYLDQNPSENSPKILINQLYCGISNKLLEKSGSKRCI